MPLPLIRWNACAGVRSRIGAAFTLLALVLFGSIGLISAREARLQSERDTAALLQQVADRLAQRLDADMAARQQEVAQLAAVHGVLPVTLEPGRWRTLLEQLQRSMPHYSWIGLADADGAVIAATGGLLQGRQVGTRPWYQQGRQRPMVGDVHEAVLLAKLLPAPADGEPLRFVDVAAPLQADGRTVGVIGAHLSWRWAEDRRREALALVPPDLGVEIVLVDRDGHVLLGPPAPRPPADAAWAEAGIRRWSEGAAQLTAASPSRPSADYPGMGWVVVVRQPTATAFAEADRLQWRLWALGTAGALLFGLLGWWLAGRLTAPLRRVAAEAQAMAPAAETLQTHDEVDQLAAPLSRLLHDLRQREQQLMALNETLEARVADRTDSLRRANEDLESFSRNVSHDLRGPLGAMAMMLRQLVAREGDTLSPRARRAVDLVVGECDRLRQLSEDLLTLAMVEQRALQPLPVDSDALVRETLAEVRRAAPAQAPRLSVDALPAVQGDATLLRQVWLNLLSNAFKYSSKVAQPTVEVSARQDGGEVVFTVADNGAGFDPAHSQRLFGVFQRLHAPSEFPGTGVGLSIVRRVVHRHGGRVWAESAPGAGARFHFALPQAPLDAHAAGAEATVGMV